jgi:HAD superfamily hydrolase (TIGR01509 family)
MTRVTALVFDFDGVILETESPAYQSWSELYASRGVDLSLSLWRDEVGSLGRFDAAAHLEGLTGWVLTTEERQARWARKLDLVAEQETMAGVEALLGEATERNVPVAVASSDTAEWVIGHLRRLGLLDRFQVIVTANGDPARAKPAPTVYSEAVAALGVAPGDAVAFEDSPNGVAAAKAAGMWCVAVPNEVTRDADLAAADWVVPTLNGIVFDDLLALPQRCPK